MQQQACEKGWETKQTVCYVGSSKSLRLRVKALSSELCTL
jgi:hypothetical protein